MPSKRQQKILEELIKEHLASGAPVPSKLLASAHPEGLSPATIRHELTELEAQGYIFQPHTSAGRVPTEKAYQFYVERVCSKPVSLDQREKQELTRAVEESGGKITERETVCRVAKTLSQLAEEAVFAAFSTDDIYYTGLTYIFQKTEFHEPTMVITISKILDHLSEAIEILCQHRLEERVVICLGSQNPFGSDCATVFVRGKKGASVLGLFGPLRMPYCQHFSRMSFLENLINS